MKKNLILIKNIIVLKKFIKNLQFDPLLAYLDKELIAAKLKSLINLIVISSNLSEGISLILLKIKSKLCKGNWLQTSTKASKNTLKSASCLLYIEFHINYISSSENP